MRLYFLRHGLADWPEWDVARDHERPLTKDGLKKMKAEAKAMATLDLQLDAILSSPYTRAYQTADIVARELGLEVQIEPLLAPGFDFERLSELVTRACGGPVAAVGGARTELQHRHRAVDRQRAPADEERRAGAGGSGSRRHRRSAGRTGLAAAA